MVLSETSKRVLAAFSERRPCQQMQCGYNHAAGCRACAECHAPPNIIKKDCSVCLTCENIPDMQRWDDETVVTDVVKAKVEVKVEVPR